MKVVLANGSYVSDTTSAALSSIMTVCESPYNADKEQLVNIVIHRMLDDDLYSEFSSDPDTSEHIEDISIQPRTMSPCDTDSRDTIAYAQDTEEEATQSDLDIFSQRLILPGEEASSNSLHDQSCTAPASKDTPTMSDTFTALTSSKISTCGVADESSNVTKDVCGSNEILDANVSELKLDKNTQQNEENISPCENDSTQLFLNDGNVQIPSDDFIGFDEKDSQVPVEDDVDRNGKSSQSQTEQVITEKNGSRLSTEDDTPKEDHDPLCQSVPPGSAENGADVETELFMTDHVNDLGCEVTIGTDEEEENKREESEEPSLTKEASDESQNLKEGQDEARTEDKAGLFEKTPEASTLSNDRQAEPTEFVLLNVGVETEVVSTTESSETMPPVKDVCLKETAESISESIEKATTKTADEHLQSATGIVENKEEEHQNMEEGFANSERSPTVDERNLTTQTTLNKEVSFAATVEEGIQSKLEAKVTDSNNVEKAEITIESNAKNQSEFDDMDDDMTLEEAALSIEKAVATITEDQTSDFRNDDVNEEIKSTENNSTKDNSALTSDGEADTPDSNSSSMVVKEVPVYPYETASLSDIHDPDEASLAVYYLQQTGFESTGTDDTDVSVEENVKTPEIHEDNEIISRDSVLVTSLEETNTCEIESMCLDLTARPRLVREDSLERFKDPPPNHEDKNKDDNSLSAEVDKAILTAVLPEIPSSTPGVTTMGTPTPMSLSSEPQNSIAERNKMYVRKIISDVQKTMNSTNGPASQSKGPHATISTDVYLPQVNLNPIPTKTSDSSKTNTVRHDTGIALSEERKIARVQNMIREQTASVNFPSVIQSSQNHQRENSMGSELRPSGAAQGPILTDLGPTRTTLHGPLRMDVPLQGEQQKDPKPFSFSQPSGLPIGAAQNKGFAGTSQQAAQYPTQLQDQRFIRPTPHDQVQRYQTQPLRHPVQMQGTPYYEPISPADGDKMRWKKGSATEKHFSSHHQITSPKNDFNQMAYPNAKNHAHPNVQPCQVQNCPQGTGNQKTSNIGNHEVISKTETRTVMASKIRSAYTKFKNKKANEAGRDGEIIEDVTTEKTIAALENPGDEHPLRMEDIEDIVQDLTKMIAKKEAELKTLYWRKACMMFISQHLREQSEYEAKKHCKVSDVCLKDNQNRPPAHAQRPPDNTPTYIPNIESTASFVSQAAQNARVGTNSEMRVPVSESKKDAYLSHISDSRNRVQQADSSKIQQAFHHYPSVPYFSGPGYHPFGYPQEDNVRNLQGIQNDSNRRTGATHTSISAVPMTSQSLANPILSSAPSIPPAHMRTTTVASTSVRSAAHVTTPRVSLPNTNTPCVSLPNTCVSGKQLPSPRSSYTSSHRQSHPAFPPSFPFVQYHGHLPKPVDNCSLCKDSLPLTDRVQGPLDKGIDASRPQNFSLPRTSTVADSHRQNSKAPLPEIPTNASSTLKDKSKSNPYSLNTPYQTQATWGAPAQYYNPTLWPYPQPYPRMPQVWPPPTYDRPDVWRDNHMTPWPPFPK